MASNFNYYFIFAIVTIVILLWFLIHLCKKSSTNEVHPVIDYELNPEELTRENYNALVGSNQQILNSDLRFEYPFVSLTTEQSNNFAMPPPTYTEATASTDTSITIPD